MPVLEIADRLEIQAALYRYCRSLDRMDKPMAYALWSEGATAKYYGMYKGTGIGFVDWVWEGHAQMQRHSHQFTNMVIGEVDGDRAASEAYGTVVLSTKPTPDVIESTTPRPLPRRIWSRKRWPLDHRHPPVRARHHVAPRDPARAGGHGAARGSAATPAIPPIRCCPTAGPTLVSELGGRAGPGPWWLAARRASGRRSPRRLAARASTSSSSPAATGALEELAGEFEATDVTVRTGAVGPGRAPRSSTTWRH